LVLQCGHLSAQRAELREELLLGLSDVVHAAIIVDGAQRVVKKCGRVVETSRRCEMRGSPRESRAMSPQAKRRQRSAKAAVRRGTTLIESDRPQRVETRMAPPRYAERRHAKPGAGIKRSRANMAPKPR